MKIAVFEADRECQTLFSTLDAKIDFYQNDINHSLKEPKPYEAISIFVHSKITESILKLLPNLRYIQTRSTGFDHIDIDACRARGIAVTNVQGYAGPPVGEFAFSLLLNITRHTDIAIARAKKGNFYYKDLLGIELFEKKIGIVGLGTIGKQMARIAHGFGMEIYAYTRHYDEEFCKRYDIQKSSFENILQTCDVIMFAVPLTPQTRHMLNEKNAVLVKKNAIVINVARGEVISNEAIKILQDRLYGLGLDVIEEEKRLFQQKPQEILDLIQSPKIRYTPHMGYYTTEALGRIRKISLDNMRRFLHQKPLLYRVD